MKLHRSLVFWGGVVVMIWLLWAWWDSRRNLAIIYLGGYAAFNAGSGFTATRWGGSGFGFEYDTLAGEAESLREVGLRWPIYLRNSGPEWQEQMMRHYLLPSDGEPEDPLMPLLLHPVMGGTGYWLLYLPYWLLVLVVAVAWGLGLGWRWRRVRRANVMVEGGEG